MTFTTSFDFLESAPPFKITLYFPALPTTPLISSVCLRIQPSTKSNLVMIVGTSCCGSAYGGEYEVIPIRCRPGNSPETPKPIGLVGGCKSA